MNRIEYIALGRKWTLKIIIPCRQSGICDRCHGTVEIYTLSGYLCSDGLESFEFGLLYLHLGTVPVLFVSFFLICHPYMSVILEQNVFILVCALLCCVWYV